jgi:hypothetical protein
MLFLPKKCFLDNYKILNFLMLHKMFWVDQIVPKLCFDVGACTNRGNIHNERLTFLMLLLQFWK